VLGVAGVVQAGTGVRWMSVGVGAPGWAIALAPIVLGPGVGAGAGAVLGLVFGREDGADIDDAGIRFVTGSTPAYATWRRIADLRTERHGGRIQVAVYLDGGSSVRLGAPYDGRLLAADPEFERKLFMLRHLWETHRHARDR
jgi:hypothetical protein